jgi:hypothetical protein
MMMMAAAYQRTVCQLEKPKWIVAAASDPPFSTSAQV